MKMSARLLAPALVLLFLSSLMIGLTAEMNAKEEPVELKQQMIQSAPSDPGHTVFAQYITSDNCGFCYQYGSPAHDQAKNSLPDRYVYISYHSASYGTTNDAESGNIAPIYGVQHLGETGGAPKTSFGDATLNTGCGSNTCWDSFISSGGNMHSTSTDYSVSVSQTDNGDGTVDVSVSASYIGSGTAPSSITLYAAVTEKVCNSHAYSDGSKGHNCWEAWLLNNGAYAHNGGNVGSGTGFETVNLNSGQAVKTWTVPTSLVNGGASNMNTVAALYSTWSTTSFNADVYAAADSTMAPKLDLAISSVSLTNPSSSNGGFVLGDTITLDVTAANVGDLDYTDGGTIQFFYKDGVNEVSISSTPLNNLISLATQTAQTDFDTSTLSSGWKNIFGARLTGLVADGNGANNVGMQEVDQDRPPITKNPQITGDQSIDRGSHALVLAKADTNDIVDTTETMSFNIEVSPTGLNQWVSSVVSGGQNVVYTGSANEGREYVITPTVTMGAGWYDVRAQAVDSRGQTGSWMVGASVFELQNGAPTVITDPIPSVMCDTLTKVSMEGHIVDPETPLEDLIVTSDDESFVAWYPLTKEIEVNFAWGELNGCPLGQQGIEISIDDGGDYSATGELPYGTLLFNVIENGQPRWNGLPSQSVVEGGSGVLALLPYLSDTNDVGESVSAEDLNIQLISNSNEEAIDAYLVGNTIGFDTIDEDANGQAILTLRASDGVKTSDTTLTINIQAVNDAPRVIPFDDIESITLKRNTQRAIDLNSRIVDVDDLASDAFITVSSSEPGAARYSFIDGSLTLLFETTGVQTVTITVRDKYDTNTYEMSVDVFDAYPFLLSQDDDGSGYMFVALEDTYVGQTPTVVMRLTDLSPTFTYIGVTWNVCNELTGTCDGLYEYDLKIAKSNVGWTEELLVPSLITAGLAREDGSVFRDYYELSIVANDGSSEYKTMTKIKWRITESMPAVEDMEDEMFTDYLEDITAERADLIAQIESAVEGDDTSELEIKLAGVEENFDTACDDPRASCIQEQQSSSETDTNVAKGLDIKLVGIIGGVVIICLLLSMMFVRRGKGDDFKEDAWSESAWNPNAVPAQDSVANSMYGGAQNLFQQPVAIPSTPQIGGPPLPPGGLPAGWTAEQWAYYGQQHLDGKL